MMSMTLEVNPEQRFLGVRVAGEITLVEANDCFARMLQAIARHEAKKVLVDCRDLTGTMSVLDRYQHATYAVQELRKAYDTGVSWDTPFAYVVQPPLFDNTRFGETVARNRGANVKVSDNLEEALQWLESA